MINKRRIVLDFETRSMCDLKAAGAFLYSLHPTTRATCLAYKERGKPHVDLFRFDHFNRRFRTLPEGFQNYWFKAILDGALFVCHNSFFETVIYKNILVTKYGWPDIPFRQFRCTAAKAAACALPRSLEGAGSALKLTTQKDKRGYVAMMKTCRPTARWNAWNKAVQEQKAGKKIGPKKLKIIANGEPKVFLEPEDDPAVWNTLYEYCKIDVLTEELLDETLPDLIPEEQEIWFLNQQINWRGVRVDTPLVKKISAIMANEDKKGREELDKLTMGLVGSPGARNQILEFLALEEIDLPDLKAKTVEDFLKNGKVTGDMKRLLEIRKALSKTSTKKYKGFLNRSGDDHRVRDLLLYHGASTGRDTGTGTVQLHNQPRSLISHKEILDVIDTLESF